MLRTVVVVGTLLLGVGAVAAQQDQVNKAELEDVGKRFSVLFPDSIKGLKPEGDYYASAKVWTDRKGFEAHAASFAKAVGDAKGKIKDLDTLKAAFPAINDECKGCHETYRVKNS